MDYHALQQKLFQLDPSDPAEDLRKLAKAAGGNAQKSAESNVNYVQESVEVPQGSLEMDRDYSVADFAALAGVRLDERQKTGSAGQAKGKDPMPKAEPGRTKHPLKDKLVGEDDSPFKAAQADGIWGAMKHGASNYNKASAANVTIKGKDAPAKGIPAKNTDVKKSSGSNKPTTQTPKGEDWPKSQEGHTLKVGDLVTYKSSKGQLRKNVPVVALLNRTKDSKGRPQIQLKLRGTTYAISRQQILAVNGEKFTLKDPAAGVGKIEALEARISYLESVIETLIEAKDERKIKPRDPNSQYMNDLRKSGAMGAHKDKKKALPRKEKHKSKQYESIKEELWAKLNATSKS